MSDPTYLIDTNILIGLEDDGEISPVMATLNRLANKYGVKMPVHEAAIEDINRDKNIERRKVTLSKLAKYDILPKIRALTKENLESEFGNIRKPNDEVDCRLLKALKVGAVDVLVTEDEGLHKRAQRYLSASANSVMHVADAVTKLRGTYEPTDVSMRYVDNVEAHTINLSDPIFDSLREGYPDFDNWWSEKCIKERRPCWVVYDDNNIAGVVVRKDETGNNTDAITPAEKILKLCTFKVRPQSRGISLGEHLLMQAFWHAQQNYYDLTYVTTYEDQTVLISLLETYGFEHTHTKDDGERIYEKPFSSAKLASDNTSGFLQAQLNYPRFVSGPNVPAFGIPIKEEYHDTLFPELKDTSQSDLFEQAGFGSQALRPGNTIRKVYVCRAPSGLDDPGSILLFYKGVSERQPSQCITAVGVLENFHMATSEAELSRLTGGRSVYSEEQLAEWKPSPEEPMKVINFLLHGYFEPAVHLTVLKDLGVMKTQPPMSIFRINPEVLPDLLARLDIGFAV